MTIDGFLGANTDEVVLAATEFEGLLGEIAALSASDPRKKRAVAKIGKATKAAAGTVRMQNRPSIHHGMTAKAMLESKQHLLNAEDRAMLQSGAWKVDDYEIMSTKIAAGGGVIEMFGAGDSKANFLRNVAFGKLEATQNFLMKGIILQTGVAAGPLDTDAVIASYGTPSDLILNGFALFKIGQLQIFEKRPLGRFKHNRTDVPANYIELESPKLIKPFEPIQFDITPAGSVVANTFVRLTFVGAITSKN